MEGSSIVGEDAARGTKTSTETAEGAHEVVGCLSGSNFECHCPSGEAGEQDNVGGPEGAASQRIGACEIDTGEEEGASRADSGKMNAGRSW